MRVVVFAAGAWMAAVPAAAQELEQPQSPRLYIGAQPLYAHTVGEFHDYVKHGGGGNVNVVLPVERGSPFGLRGDVGFIVYGSESKRVCFSATVGCRVQLDLVTTNTIAFLNAGPQLMVPSGKVRPYVNGAIGLSYFGTSSSVNGSSGNETFAGTTNFDDVTFAWNTGGGVLVALGARSGTPVMLDFSVRYHGNGRAEYLKKGDITDNPDGSITLAPTRSQANLLTFQVGLTAGVGTQR